MTYLTAIAGIKYAFIGKSFEQRPSYRVLGTLLFMQLAITTSLAAADALTQQLQPQQTVASSAEVSGAKPGHAILLQARFCLLSTLFASALRPGLTQSCAESLCMLICADTLRCCTRQLWCVCCASRHGPLTILSA